MRSQPDLRAALAEYLAVRRTLGYKLVRAGLLLEQFITFVEESGETRLTTALAIAWITSPAGASPSWLCHRLTVVRGFASWLQASDPDTEVPPVGWLPPRWRATPYLYTDTEVVALMAAARRARWPISAATYENLIGLLAVTGMRVGEVIRLDQTDVSLDEGLVTITNTKFGKSRQVVLDPSTVRALDAYLERRAALSPVPGEAAFFVHPAGNRITYESVQAMFHTLARRAGVTARSESCRPTIHGLRHTFAVKTLVNWYKNGEDVQAKLPLLSTWLGHSDPKSTFWYLSAAPELLALAAERVESRGWSLS